MSPVPAFSLGPLGRLALRGASVVASLARAWERRRIVGRLGLLDDHMLRDLGISRQDIQSVLAEPLYRDPTERLAARVTETRMARRALAELSLAFARQRDDQDRVALPRPPERRAA